MSKSPLEQVKDKFGDKTKLVAALRQLTGDELWLTRGNEGKGLDHVSNAKLLKLHATFSFIKENFGTRLKLVSAITELEGRSKDEGYEKRLATWPVPRLYDHWRSTKKRLSAAKKAAEAKAAPPAEKKPAEKKAPAAKAAPKAAVKKAPAKPVTGKAAAAKKAAASKGKKSGKLAPQHAPQLEDRGRRGKPPLRRVGACFSWACPQPPAGSSSARGSENAPLAEARGRAPPRKRR
ncbi:MAG: hypothetical protein MUF34_09880 [Polyangiaceae bacterium]|nr:hypothetical protein [Polyangiaceae bacterium]